MRMMKKRMISLGLAILMVVSLLPINELRVHAVTAKSGSQTAVDGTNWTITWTLNEKGVLEIKGARTSAAAAAGTTPSSYNYTHQEEKSISWLNNSKDIYEVIVDASLSGLTDMSYMFYGCENLEKVTFKGGTAAVVDFASTFKNCKSLRTVEGLRVTTSTKYCNDMFNGCKNLVKLNCKAYNAITNPTGWQTTNVETMENMFNGCECLSEFDPTGWDTTNVTCMSHMFADCNMVNLDLRAWNTKKCQHMDSMFKNCYNLEVLNLKNWDVTNITTFESMFEECRSLTTLDITGWKTYNNTTLKRTFYDCELLPDLDIAGWDTSSVTDMSELFYNCRLLTSLNLNAWDTHLVTTMKGMFRNCVNLQYAFTSSWDTCRVTTMEDMFRQCTSMTDVYSDNWKLDALTNISAMFYNAAKCSADITFITKITSMTDCFLGAATAANTSIKVYYDIDCDEATAQSIVATKSVNSAVSYIQNVVYVTLTYNGNGGSPNRDNKRVKLNDKWGSLTKAKRSGYTFDGWYTDADGGTRVTSGSTASESTMVYAHWTKVKVGKLKGLSAYSGSKKKFAVSVTAPSTGATGYQIQISRSKSMSSVKNYFTTKRSKGITGLSSGKTYYVRVRAYKVDSTGNKVYGSWSAKKKVKVK